MGPLHLKDYIQWHTLVFQKCDSGYSYFLLICLIVFHQSTQPSFNVLHPAPGSPPSTWKQTIYGNTVFFSPLPFSNSYIITIFQNYWQKKPLSLIPILPRPETQLYGSQTVQLSPFTHIFFAFTFYILFQTGIILLIHIYVLYNTYNTSPFTHIFFAFFLIHSSPDCHSST